MTDLTISSLDTTSLSDILADNICVNSSQAETSNFQQILSYMLFSDLNATLYSDSKETSVTSETNKTKNLITPALQLFEQMQLQQVMTQVDTSSTAGVDSTSPEDILQEKSENSFWPVEGPLTWDYIPGTHNGMDFGIPVGTPITSSIVGKAVYAGWSDAGYGNLVIVDNGTFKTYYGHLSSIPVSVGQTVEKGEVIGYSGNTGNSTGPHLHYEVRENNVVIDPKTLHKSIV